MKVLRSLRANLLSGVEGFLFSPASPKPLAVLRILFSAVLLLQASLVAQDYFEFYGSDGIFQGALRHYFSREHGPTLAAITDWASTHAFTEEQALLAVGLTYITSLLFLLLGFKTRAAAGLAWLTHFMLAGDHFASYGVDQIAQLFLFSFIWMPTGACLSLDYFRNRGAALPNEWARISLRVLQIQLCIIYLSSGIGKTLGDQWWSGEAIWRSLMLPVYNQFNFSWISHVPWIAKLAAWGTLLIEIGYPILIWPSRTRSYYVGIILMLHLGIGVFLGLGIFATLMGVLTLCLFGMPSEDPHSRRQTITNSVQTTRFPLSASAAALSKSFLF